MKDAVEIIDKVFRTHYGIGEFQRHVGEQEGESLDYVLEELTESVEHEIAEALMRQLINDEICFPQDGDEPFYDDTQNYIMHDVNQGYHSAMWHDFCDTIVHTQRFYNENARGLISEIFDGIQFQRDHKKNTPVYEIKPGDKEATFFRARVAGSKSKREKIFAGPQTELGPPPKRQRQAGRMNSAGIACCYGAFDFETCLSELRPVVGSIVVGTQFELVRAIHVLDTTRFEAPIKLTSMFSENYLVRVEQWAFMQNFMDKIAKPILPTDEYLDYIPTQAVAEYLLHHHEFKRGGKLAKVEGIIYKSAQNPSGKNIVLLGEAAQTKPPEIISNKKNNPKTSDRLSLSLETILDKKSELQNPGIRIVENTVQVHFVRSASYQSTQYHEYYTDSDDDEF